MARCAVVAAIGAATTTVAAINVRKRIHVLGKCRGDPQVARTAAAEQRAIVTRRFDIRDERAERDRVQRSLPQGDRALILRFSRRSASQAPPAMDSRILPFAILAAFATHAAAQQPKTAAPSAARGPGLAAPLPVDPTVRIGTLPNGIRYYIRQNKKPEKRAELRLVVNAGAVLENDDQLGLAHFVEHTAFNGTTHFAKNDLVKYLQSIGVRFGADLNAYTGFDETVYILPIPTDTARIVEQAFTILEDWAHGQVFDSTEVVNERGVVREEWRLGKGAGDRMLHQWLPIALHGSRYADRLPIGNEQSIMSATPARLRSFYKS